MAEITTEMHHDTIQPGEYLLVGDIGGTNANFAVVTFVDSVPQLLVTLNAQSQQVEQYHTLIQAVCDRLESEHQIQVRSACFGIAGIVQDHCQCVEPTNLEVKFDAREITEQTQLQELIVINDFEAVATGVDHVADQDLICVKDGSGLSKANKAAFGAGTGLGKVGMVWHRPAQQYLPVASEGGHSDFAVYDALDIALTAYIQQEKGNEAPVSWEDVLSGRGIRRIYQFLGTQKAYPETEVSREIASADFNPDKISQYADQDARARETFTLYAQWSGRCARNWALDMCAFNGLYIAGGIAAKNLAVFHDDAFTKTFCANDVHTEFLQQTPVYVVADYYVTLYGAAAYYQLYADGIL